jgi:hypothetical protein
MFNRKTVFIVGAGCSAEYGLPVGDGLKTQIAERLKAFATMRERAVPKQDVGLNDALNRSGHGTIGAWFEVAANMAQGVQLTSSIDRYLNLRQDDARLVILGKLLIVRAILAAEAESTLAVPDGKMMDHGDIATGAGGLHWLGQLFEQMQEGVSNRSQLSHVFENVSFVSFNYDRCIEHYFFNALRQLGSLTGAEASEAMKSLVIEHPYGRVGHLPWEDAPPGAIKAKFGERFDDGEVLNRLAGGIKTFTERVEEGDELARTRKLITDATQIAFLGFSFLDQNMDLLTPPQGGTVHSIYATVYEEPDPNLSIFESSIRTMLAGRAPNGNPVPSPKMEPEKAGRFMREWGNRLRRG